MSLARDGLNGNRLQLQTRVIVSNFAVVSCENRWEQIKTFSFKNSLESCFAATRAFLFGRWLLSIGEDQWYNAVQDNPRESNFAWASERFNNKTLYLRVMDVVTLIGRTARETKQKNQNQLLIIHYSLRRSTIFPKWINSNSVPVFSYDFVLHSNQTIYLCHNSEWARTTDAWIELWCSDCIVYRGRWTGKRNNFQLRNVCDMNLENINVNASERRSNWFFIFRKSHVIKNCHQP